MNIPPPVDIDTFPNPACLFKVRLHETVDRQDIALRDFPPWSEANSGGLLILKNSRFSRLFIEELTETLQGHWFIGMSHIDMLCHADAILTVLRMEALAKIVAVVSGVVGSVTPTTRRTIV